MSAPEVIIIGTGPAGVSAAYPLVEAGIDVLLLDGGRTVPEFSPRGSYLAIRTRDPDQWKMLLGEDLHSLGASGMNSPKFRAATLKSTFEGFDAAYPNEQRDFSLVGSLATGGLSNVWGAGVARFDEEDLREFPIGTADLELSYRAVSARVGISGVGNDDLRDVFGTDASLHAPTDLDGNAARLLARYSARRYVADRCGIRMGRARNAVITRAHEGREPCDYNATCLWGCSNRSIYSARFDVSALLRRANCRLSAATVKSIRRESDGYRLEAIRPGGETTFFRAPRVILACGTIGTTKLVFELIGRYNVPVRLRSTPSAAFAILLPERVGCPVAPNSFGLAQLSFSITRPASQGGPAFGNIFGTAGIPMFEFVRRAPVGRRCALRLFRMLLPSMLLGNCFWPGDLSLHSLTLRSDGTLYLSGAFHEEMAEERDRIRKKLARLFVNLAATMLPGSFSEGEPGSDAHYAGTIPMRADPGPGESDVCGEVAGAPGLFVVDGAALTALPAKSHTLTIMANADRIARILARELRS